MDRAALETLQGFLVGLDARMKRAHKRGQVAHYIPQLASVDLHQFGISVCLASGEQLSAGDAATPFSIQSISKVFSLAIALGRHGDRLWKRVGKEPSNYTFNSVIELEQEGGKPRNPFVNAGALVTTDAMLDAPDAGGGLDRLMDFVRTAAGDDRISIDEQVAASEYRTAYRNFSLAYFLRSCGNLHMECERLLQIYCRQCAITMNCEQLASAGRFLAGFDSAAHLLNPAQARSINALMLLAGHYDGSGDFAYSVGFPGKSGVGGGILAVVPGHASIAVWSPGLNAFGNSLLGTRALQELSEFTGWSVF